MRDLTGTVLDVGGGRHALHDDAWTTGVRRIRLDLSAAHRPDVQADAARLPVSDASVDAVLLIEVLEHVREPQATVLEARRVLRKGGMLIGSCPFVAPIHGDPNDFYRYSDEGLRHLLAPFTWIRIRPLGNHYGAAWSLLAARSRTLRVLNPLLRGLGTRTDPRCPQGYVFVAHA